MRGNQPLAFESPTLRRSIPAGAGEPSAGSPWHDLDAVYPRGCGGTLLLVYLTLTGKGLSPRVRGNPLASHWLLVGAGSIPAGAGEPIRHAPLPRERKVYPRGCGGTYRCDLFFMWQYGLSPRVRGNHDDRISGFMHYGSIPAGAGEPTRQGNHGWRYPVYPRGCGGTDYYYGTPYQATGLSPRVRGNLVVVIVTETEYGSIPAGAGEPVRLCQRDV